MNVVIKIENLYKEYRLGSIGYATLRQDIQRIIAEIQGKPDPNSIIGSPDANNKKKRLLALNNINLDIKEGDSIAIVGANGAGKSTLLKLISRITAPTKGVIKIKGRVTSLISLGTGFHPELSGMENIFLNGSILGLRKYEIESKLNKIVEFSGIGDFLNTPVKRYSSGMVVRLGFSVAAHLDPDILITDEILAVADLDFRERSMNKLAKISNSGKTIIFVSHNLNSVRKMCNDAILLDNGKILNKGKVENILSEYISLNKKTKFVKSNRILGPDIEPISMVNVKIINNKENAKDIFLVTEKIGIVLTFEVKEKMKDVFIKVQLFSSNHIHIFNSIDLNSTIFEKIGSIQRTMWIDKNVLNEDSYYLNASLISPPYKKPKIHLNIDSIASFETIFDDSSISVKGKFKNKWGGVMAPKFLWTD